MILALNNRPNTIIQIVKRVDPSERSFLKRFEIELRQFVKDQNYIMLVPTHRVKITLKNKSLRVFIDFCGKYFEKFNQAILEAFAAAVANPRTTSLQKYIYQTTRCNYERIFRMEKSNIAEGICSYCNSGILYKKDDYLLCSICSRRFCKICYEYISPEEVNHDCIPSKKKEIEALEAISTTCPFCGRRIQKVENTCNSMFCIFCKRGFDYETKVELKHEFHNIEREVWLNSIKKEYSTNLSSQLRNFAINNLQQIILNYVDANKDSPISKFLSNSSLFYTWSQINHFEIKKAFTSKKSRRHENLIYERELREFIYSYFEIVCGWLDTSASDLEIAKSLDSIFTHLDVVYRLSSMAPSTISFFFEDSINIASSNWLINCEKSIEVVDTLAKLKNHISFSLESRNKLRLIIESLEVKYDELVPSSDLASLQIKNRTTSKYLDVQKDEDGFAVFSGKKITRITRGLVANSQFRLSPRTKVSFAEKLKNWGL